MFSGNSFRRIAWAVGLSVPLLLGKGSGLFAEDEDTFVAIKAGTVITVSGEEHSPGMIVLRNGKVDAVGKKVEVPWGAEVIDAPDEVVMPGLVNPRTRHSLRRYSRSGVRANLTIKTELDPDPDDFKSVLEAGFTTIGLYPEGRGFPGQALAVHPVPGGYDEMKVKENAYVRAVLATPSADKKVFRDGFARAKAEIEKVEKARKAWEEKKKKEAEAAKKKAEEEKKKKEQEKKPGDKPAPQPQPKKQYQDKPPEKPKPKDGKPEEKKKDEFKPPPINPAYVPLVDLIQKKEGVQLLIEINSAGDLLHLNEVVERSELDIAHRLYVNNRPAFSSFMSSGVDLGYVLDELGEMKPKVLLHPNLNKHQMTANQFNLPAELARRGCEIAFAPLFAHDRLREQVAQVVKAGLDRKVALEALTRNAAAVLGLDDRIGTIEKDKDGDLVFLSHDPFDARARVTRVMIGGEIVAEPEPPRTKP